MRVAKWGNSLAIRLPAILVKDMGLAEGDEVQLSVRGAHASSLSKKPGKAEILAALRAFEGRLPADFKFDRDRARER